MSQKIFDTKKIYRYNDGGNKSLRTSLTDCYTVQKGMTDMKSTGIIRKVDDLGRIVLPIELRRMLNIVERDELEIFVESDRIILCKYESSCIFCGKDQNLVEHASKNVCCNCINKLRNM